MILGKYKVVDAHCHIYPEKIAERAVHGTDEFYGLHSYGQGLVSCMMREEGAAGVDGFIVQSVASVTHQVPSINAFIAKEVAAHPGKLVGLGTLHPFSKNLESDFADLLAYGLHGVKLHPDIQHFKVDDERCFPIYEKCQALGLPILLHTGDHRYDNSNPNRVRPVLEAFPGLTVIGAHLGGWSVWEEAARELSPFENFYVDTSSSSAFMEREAFKQLILTFGTHRVLFGTDYPMWRADEEIEALLSLGLTDEEYRAIFFDNAIKAYKLHKSDFM